MTQPAPNDLVAIATDGSTHLEFGSWYISAKTPWDDWFAGTLKFPFLDMHNPGGNNKGTWDGGKWFEPMMQFHQFSRMTAYAKSHTADKDAKARADWKAFVRGLRMRTDAGLWTMGYVGGFAEDSFPIKAGEHPKDAQERSLRELKPFFEGGINALCLDAEIGPRGKDANSAKNSDPSYWTERERLIYGPQKMAHFFWNYVKRQGIECVIESHTYEDFPQYHNHSILIQTIRWNSFQYRGAERLKRNAEAEKSGLKFTGRGDSTWNTGSHKARPVRESRLHPRVYQKVDTLGTVAQDLENVRLARANGHIPCVTINTIRPEMYVIGVEGN